MSELHSQFITDNETIEEYQKRPHLVRFTKDGKKGAKLFDGSKPALDFFIGLMKNIPESKPEVFLMIPVEVRMMECPFCESGLCSESH